MKEFFNRMLRASKLDINLYEEVESDKSLFSQSMLVVILSSVAAGIGAITQGGFSGIILGTISAIISWFIWAYITYIIGSKLLPTSETVTDYGELLRTIGFSSAPGIIRIIGIIPGLTSIIFFIANIWMLIAMVIAVRQALDYTSTLRAVGVCIIGWIIQLFVIWLVMVVFGM